jgi:hypothetical protein
MDLERCPKCGNAWIAGIEKCRQCGFVPIGAGLKNAPKQKKRKAGKYVEPGSARGLLTTIFVGLLAFGCYRYKPWADDWEMVRVMLGQGRRHSIVGEWEIVKTLTVEKGKPAVLSQSNIRSGSINFSKQGDVKMVFQTPGVDAVAKGRYVVSGQLVAMNAMRSDEALAGIPSSMRMQLSWTGPDQVLASMGGEVVYMRRRDTKNPLVSLMKVGLTGDTKGGQAPGAMRGVVSQMESQLKDIDGQD